MKKMIIGMGIFIFFNRNLPAQNILWVSGNTSRDQGFIDLLESQGYTVDRMADSQSMDASKQALANTYDLVIIGRDLISGSYDDSDTEIGLWNGITAPMMNMTGYLLRSNRWRWVKSDSIKDTAYPSPF